MITDNNNEQHDCAKAKQAGALAVVGAENARNWAWFMKRLISDFPGTKVLLSDKDKESPAPYSQLFFS